MPAWLNEQKLICAAAALLFAGMVWNTQRGWLTLADGSAGAAEMGGDAGHRAQQDSFRVDLIDEGFDAYSLPEARNVFEALDKMLPMPPVTLQLPALPRPGVLSPLPQPTPPSAGHGPCQLADEPWPAVAAAPPVDVEDGDASEGAGEGDTAGDGSEAGGEVASTDDDAAPAVPAGWDDPRVRPHDTLVFKGSGNRREGRILRELGSNIVFETAGDRARYTYQRSDIQEILPAKSLAEFIEDDFTAIRADDEVKLQKLLERCLAAGAPDAVREVAERWGLRFIGGDRLRGLEVYELLAGHFRARFDLEGEMRVYRGALKQGELLPVQLVRGLGDLYMRIGIAEEARALVEGALLRRQGDEGLRVVLSEYLLEAGRFEEAIAALETLGATALAKPAIAALMARAHYLAGDFGAARARLAFAATDPAGAPAEALVLLGAAQLASGDREGARASFTAVAARQVGDEVAAVPGFVLGMASYNLGVIDLLAADAAAALAHFDRAQEVDPTSPWPSVGQGFIAEMSGDHAQARAHYEAALRIQPRLGYAHLALGRIAEKASEALPARSDYQLAFVQDFELTDAVARLGYLAARAGGAGLGHEHYYEALDFLGEASRRTPEDVLLRLQVAHCQLALGEIKAAEEIFTVIASDRADNLDALAGLAYVKNAASDELRSRAYLQQLEAKAGGRAEMATFAQEAIAAIDRNLLRWRWVDGFNRTGEQPRREWLVEQEAGVRVALDPKADLSGGTGEEAGAVRFSGVQAADAAWKLSLLEREIDPKSFVSFKARVDTRAAGKALVGVCVRLADEQRSTELLWGRTGEGKLAWRMTSRGTPEPWNEVADYPEGDLHDLEVQVELVRGNQRMFRLLIDGVVVRDESAGIKNPQLTAIGGKSVRVGIAAGAPAYEEYGVIVDDVELVEQRAKE